MKKHPKKLTLKKLKISKLNQLNTIFGGGEPIRGTRSDNAINSSCISMNNCTIKPNNPFTRPNRGI
ncbi:hypothetical protein [Aquimarina longa]|uniref:hypothetical protein n=1 Tax=Aquimarina longa TaxID=1080221 RepID=UPI0007824180|nr:hypothetical protein [Aquimarina longa]